MFNSLGPQGNQQVILKAMKICLFHADTLLSGPPQHLSTANISWLEENNIRPQLWRGHWAA